MFPHLSHIPTIVFLHTSWSYFTRGNRKDPKSLDSFSHQRSLTSTPLTSTSPDKEQESDENLIYGKEL